MVHKIHEKVGTAGFIISIVALVVALGGGAYAASGGLTGKQKKEVEKIAKKYAGKQGATGATGPAGAAGAKGDAGSKGDAGAPGAKGDAGAEGKQGKEGSPWTAGGTLPSGKTETGTFGYATQLATGNVARVPISFPIPLAAPLAEGHVHLVTSDGTGEIVINELTEVPEVVAPTGCGTALTPAGTVTNPRAGAGQLCVYIGKMVPINTGTVPHAASNYIVDPSVECEGEGCLPSFGGPGSGAGVAGATVQVAQSGSGTNFYGNGTWAVTAP